MPFGTNPFNMLNWGTGNPYGIPSNYPLPPEAYGRSGPPAGYQTYTGATGGLPSGTPDWGGSSLPPAAAGVRPGPAYGNTYPGLDLSGEPTVIVNQPQDAGGGDGGLPIPSVPSFDWIQPRNADRGGSASPAPSDWAQNATVPQDWQENAASQNSLLQHALNVMASNFAQQQNMSAFGLHDWNRGLWQANPSAGEGGAQGDARHDIGALAARLGMMGRSASGKWRGRQA